MIGRGHSYEKKKCASQAILSRMQLTLHATRRTPDGALRLVQAKSAWSVKTRRAPSRHCSDTRVYAHTTCVALPTNLFFCKRPNRQLEPPLPLNFSCRTFRNYALAPNFPFEPKFGKADMGSLVHSRECGKATAVSVPSFEADLVAEG